nr:hypothetical protein Q903MT_gene1518 [Picea sitchensis]
MLLQAMVDRMVVVGTVILSVSGQLYISLSSALPSMCGIK